MPSACSVGFTAIAHVDLDAPPPLPSTLTIITKSPQDWNPLELFISRFEPNSIDGKLHAAFRPSLHAALEYYAANREEMYTSVPAEASKVKIDDEHAAGLDG